MTIACVFGGAGFLGSHVSDALTNSGYEVRIFDRSPSRWLQPGQEMIVGDLLNENDVQEAVKDAEVVYNFAALADLNEALNKPLETIRVNILGNGNILEACRLTNVRRFIYASTVYVYSREGGFYRCSKQAAESYVQEYSAAYGLDYTILRFGSLYGPRSDHRNGLWNIISTAVRSGTVQYAGNSESIREYIHVEDAASASVSVLANEFKNQHIVLTGHEPMLVRDLLKMIAEILGISKEVEFEDREYSGHYIRTPYAYEPKLGKKFIPPLHVDLGQGLLQLISEVQKNELDMSVGDSDK